MKRCSTATPHAARLEPHESNTPTTARHPCLLRAFPPTAHTRAPSGTAPSHAAGRLQVSRMRASQIERA
jgi:hypothetical protein